MDASRKQAWDMSGDDETPDHILSVHRRVRSHRRGLGPSDTSRTTCHAATIIRPASALLWV
jgi:hypothetical protein